MPVRRTLMPVVDPVAIQEAKLEVQGTIEHLIALGDLSYSIVPSDALFLTPSTMPVSVPKSFVDCFTMTASRSARSWLATAIGIGLYKDVDGFFWLDAAAAPDPGACCSALRYSSWSCLGSRHSVNSRQFGT